MGELLGLRGGLECSDLDYLRSALDGKRGALERQPTKHVRTHTNKLKPLNHFTVVPYPHCVSTGYGPKAGAVTRARCARRRRGVRDKCEQDECKVVQRRDGQGARFGKIGTRFDKQASWTVALPAWAASRLTS